ncbi:MAG TPA: aminotransferase class I/II-fold pyridoxal phosphate-dependent enzyme [Acidimicrobiales bacterium]|nr:aminotransferase class I/II-fold pyridoxal phosphate-dependent enzyme [Acidimicrobiales bacterium]
MRAAPSAFARLRALLEDIDAPAGREPVALHLGESRLVTPPLGPALAADLDGWTRYPPLGGTDELRAAYTGWLERRFGLRTAFGDRRVTVEPTPGAKQAVAAVIALAATAARQDGVAPVVVLPDPGYPTYRAGTATVGARAVPYHLDDPGDPGPVAAAVQAAGGRVAAIVACTPGNPQGDVLPPRTLRRLSRIAADAGAVLIVDECYVDLAVGPEPTGYLSLVERGLAGPGAFVVVHTLSKRSAAPGLRSGFVAGDPATVGTYAAHNRSCGVSTPTPVCAAAAALWADDTHVAEHRAALARNWEVADAVLGHLPAYRRADAGFFLWLPVVDDIETTRALWRDQGLSVMPGRYLATPDAIGDNPGRDHLRVALVHDEATLHDALTRLRAVVAPRPGEGGVSRHPTHRSDPRLTGHPAPAGRPSEAHHA